MSQVVERKSFSSVKENMTAYFKSHDIQFIDENAEFINLSTGEHTVGREAIGQMLHHIYHVAFDARLDVKNYIITEDKAMLEGDFIGTHIGEFASFPPTNKKVNVPLCVSYDLKEGMIKEGRIYMAVNVMMEQLIK